MKYCPLTNNYCLEHKCAWANPDTEFCLVAEALGFYIAEKKAKEEAKESEEYRSRIKEKMDSFILRGKTYD